MDSLRRLPDNAVFTVRSGHATMTIGRHGNNIVAYAAADSIQQLSYTISEQMDSKFVKTESKEKTSTPAQTFVAFKTKAKWCLCGVLAGFLLLMIFKIWIKYDTHSR